MAIETSYVIVESTGGKEGRILVTFYQDDETIGPAEFPARNDSFAAIIVYAETQFNHRKLTMSQKGDIEELLDPPWPKDQFRFDWKDTEPQ